MSDETPTVLDFCNMLCTKINAAIKAVSVLTDMIPASADALIDINHLLNGSLSATEFFIARNKELPYPEFDGFVIRFLRDYLSLIQCIHSKLYQVELLCDLVDSRTPDRVLIPLEGDDWKHYRQHLDTFEQRLKSPLGPTVQRVLDNVWATVGELQRRNKRDNVARAREVVERERNLDEVKRLREDVSIMRKAWELLAREHSVRGEDKNRRRSW